MALNEKIKVKMPEHCVKVPKNGTTYIQYTVRAYRNEKGKPTSERIAIGKLDTEKKKIEQEVKVYMQQAEIAENDRFLVSWKNTVTNRIDSTRLKEEMPEVYQRFVKPSQSRRLLIKAV